MKQALVVRGGWDGHAPVAATDMFLPHLEASGFTVRIVDTPEVYAEAAMADVDLIVQCYTMGEASGAAVAGLRDAVRAGTGLVGWHGGIADSFRASSDYLQLVGGQFATHPSKHPDDVHGDQSDNYLPYTVDMLPEAAEHPVTAGIASFELTTEQYWVLTDGLCDVLATTTHPAPPWHPWHRPLTCPAVWTRQWGAGRICVVTPGHSLDVLEHPSVRTMIERSMVWASR
ncbi:ThuA domain-containing protein [Cellulomonas sp. S1-8]|uniref:ThuA domain-containing protein n=1 Tax=Cellulomonas sp. S1-8 TaxID=2904790 RepID=UPI002243F37A|nr:ThuA domain-containing protein [Cellulomonas sp. S1-8]UZN04575.1 ThuA domain-containing protein [Cellulomonas sp. S1-8]